MKSLDIPCIIVAGGKSSRMGSDKALLPFGGFETLTQYQIARLTPWFESVHVSAKSKDKFAFECNFIADSHEFETFSPLVALYSILQKLQRPTFIVSVDTPFVSQNIIEELCKQSKSHTVTLARSPYGSHQMCGIYKPEAMEVIKEHILMDMHKIRKVLDRLNTLYVDFEDDKPFTNLNHPHEYEEAKELQLRIDQLF